MLTKIIYRTCAVCGKELKIRLLRLINRILWGGYFFSMEGPEYWECKTCYNKE